MSKKINGRTFTPDYHCIRRSNGFISEVTGDVILWSAVEQSVWSTLYDQWYFFTSQSKPCRNTMTQLAEMCNVSKSAIGRAVEKFEEHGLIVIDRSVKGRKTNYVYAKVIFPKTCKAVKIGRDKIKSFKVLSPVNGTPLEGPVDTAPEAADNTPEEIYIPENIRWREEDLEDPLDSFY